MTSSKHDEWAATRPEVQPDTPFAAVVDALVDAAVAVAKVLDLVTDDGADLREEFPLRDTEEQTAFGVKVALTSLSITGLSQSIAGAVADLFQEFDTVSADAA